MSPPSPRGSSAVPPPPPPREGTPAVHARGVVQLPDRNQAFESYKSGDGYEVAEVLKKSQGAAPVCRCRGTGGGRGRQGLRCMNGSGQTEVGAQRRGRGGRCMTGRHAGVGGGGTSRGSGALPRPPLRRDIPPQCPPPPPHIRAHRGSECAGRPENCFAGGDGMGA